MFELMDVWKRAGINFNLVVLKNFSTIKCITFDSNSIPFKVFSLQNSQVIFRFSAKIEKNIYIFLKKPLNGFSKCYLFFKKSVTSFPFYKNGQVLF